MNQSSMKQSGTNGHFKHIGIDDHARTLAVGIADADGSHRFYGEIQNTPDAVDKLLKALATEGSTLVVWYEAGPCGYGLRRQIVARGHRCHVVAPSLTPRRVGQRVKTDQRDCVALAKLGRSGELTPVWVPDEAHEAMRDLSRSREDAVIMQRQARQQLSGLLLRHGRRYEEGKRKWTQMFLRWLDQQKFDNPVLQEVFDEYVETVVSATERVERIEKRMREALEQWELKAVVQALLALRGVDLVTAMTLVTEIGDLRRFKSPRQLMSYLGLTPSEHSSGEKTRRGGLTKAGNTHARRVLVEAAWSYRHPARKTEHLRRKGRDAPQVAQDIAWKAQQRLCKRYRTLTERGKVKVQACAAVARELAGFVWAIGCAVWPTEASGRAGESSATL